MSKKSRIFNTNLILISVVSLRWQFHILEKSAKNNFHCFCKMLYWSCLRGLGIWLRTWRYERSEYGCASKYARVFYLPGLFTWICQVSQHTSALNIWGLWICYGSEYAGFTLASEYTWISLDSSWIYLNMCHYATMLTTSLILSWVVSLRWQFVIFQNSEKIDLQ